MWNKAFLHGIQNAPFEETVLKKTELYGPTEERDMGLHKKKKTYNKIRSVFKTSQTYSQDYQKIFKCTTESFINETFSYFRAFEALLLQ